MRRRGSRLRLSLAFALVSGCASSAAPGSLPAPPAPAAAFRTTADTFYVAVLSTTRHALDGRNPVVGVFRSTDGGSGWEHLGWEQGKAVAVAGARAVGAAATAPLLVAQGNGVHLSLDEGRTWRIATDWRVTEVQDVAHDPAREGRLFAGTAYGVFRSEDDGATWMERNRGLPEVDGTFVSALRADRLRAGRVLAGTEAGLFVSDDAGDSWRPLAVREPVRSVRQSPSDPDAWAVALQGRGAAFSDDGGERWRYATGAAAKATLYDVEFHPTNPDVLYAGGWRTGVLVSRDGGRTWTRSREGPGEGSVHGVAASSATPGLLLAGTMGDGLFRSLDDGRTWEPLALRWFEGAQMWDVTVRSEW